MTQRQTRNVAVVAGGHTRWGKREATWRDLIQEAGKATFDAVDGVTTEDVEGLFVGTVQPERFANQSHVAPLVAELLGINVTRMTARTELACASGQAALRYAWLAIAAGQIDVAFVIGAEKMVLSGHESEAQFNNSTVMTRGFDAPNVINAPPFFAQTAQRHMHEYGTTREQMAMVSAKNKTNAAANEYAQFRKEVSIDDVLDSYPLSPPLCLFDCSGVTDGAAGAILMSEDKALEVTDTAAWITGSGQSTLSGNSINNLGELTRWEPARVAAQHAYEQAGIDDPVRDVDMAEVHDCFSISEILAYEELGWVEKGEGGSFVEEGRSELDGDIAVNPRGGLLGMGHPLGATGVSQAIEILDQFRGDVPSGRRVDSPEIGLTHNLSGPASVHSIMTYQRERPEA